MEFNNTEGADMDRIPYTDATELTDAQCRRLKAQDEIGFYCTGMGAQNDYWQRATVIGHDRQTCALFVQEGHESMVSLWYREGDDIVRWPKS